MRIKDLSIYLKNINYINVKQKNLFMYNKLMENYLDT